LFTPLPDIRHYRAFGSEFTCDIFADITSYHAAGTGLLSADAADAFFFFDALSIVFAFSHARAIPRRLRLPLFHQVSFFRFFFRFPLLAFFHAFMPRQFVSSSLLLFAFA